LNGSDDPRLPCKRMSARLVDPARWEEGSSRGRLAPARRDAGESSCCSRTSRTHRTRACATRRSRWQPPATPSSCSPLEAMGNRRARFFAESRSSATERSGRAARRRPMCSSTPSRTRSCSPDRCAGMSAPGDRRSTCTGHPTRSRSPACSHGRAAIASSMTCTTPVRSCLPRSSARAWRSGRCALRRRRRSAARTGSSSPTARSSTSSTRVARRRASRSPSCATDRGSTSFPIHRSSATASSTLRESSTSGRSTCRTACSTCPTC
jgi:hypothetical protein